MVWVMVCVCVGGGGYDVMILESLVCVFVYPCVRRRQEDTGWRESEGPEEGLLKELPARGRGGGEGSREY